jgi:hypothetical protein
MSLVTKLTYILSTVYILSGYGSSATGCSIGGSPCFIRSAYQCNLMHNPLVSSLDSILLLLLLPSALPFLLTLLRFASPMRIVIRHTSTMEPLEFRFVCDISWSCPNIHIQLHYFFHTSESKKISK